MFAPIRLALVLFAVVATLPALGQTAPPASPGPPPGTDAPSPAPPPVSTPAMPDGTIDEDLRPSLPLVFYGEADLPAPVRDRRKALIEAAKTGDIEALRPIIEANGGPPDLPGGDEEADPITTLKLLSGDEEGREILAIMLDVLESGYVRADIGTPQEAYVWPYFTRIPLDRLTPPQLVEIYRVIGAGDLIDMQEKGVYSFYRLGITPDGTWRFFEDGD